MSLPFPQIKKKNTLKLDFKQEKQRKYSNLCIFLIRKKIEQQSLSVDN